MTAPDDFQAIIDLDLDPIKVKLMHQESGEGWSLDKANAVAFEYRRFLILMKKYPEEQTAPLLDVDIFWHYHILDTLKYAKDCEQIFGYFLHHFPYIGLRGEADEAAHVRVGQRMKELYEQTFGEAYLRAPASQNASGQSAWSGVAAQSAWAGIAVKAAFPDGAARTAFSGVAADTTQTTWSDIAAKTAWSGIAAQTAWSGIAAQTAWSGIAAPTAWSGIAAPSASGATTQAGEPARFYTERPSLPLA